MNPHSRLSRRGFLRNVGLVTGAAAASRWVDMGPGLGSSLFGISEAHAAPPTKSAVVSIFFEGGFNALFSSPDSFLSRGDFGVTNSNAKAVGSGLFVDASTFGTLGEWALGHMAAIGNRHGATDHPSAQKNIFRDGARQYLVSLAAALGGSAAFKAVALGSLPTAGPSMPEGGVSLQLLRSLGDVSTALGIGPVDTHRPARDAAALAMAGARAMSSAHMAANPESLSFARDAFDTNLDSLSKPPLALDVASVAQAYGTREGAGLDSIPAKLAAAEIMVRAGTNVLSISDTGWDTHGDRGGDTVRRRMSAEVIPALKTFLTRMRTDPELAAMNITVIIHGDFARSLPSSDHAPALSALVIGPRVKVGTTGKVSARVQLPENTGASREMWAYVAAVSQVAQNPFGTNPHALVL